MSKSRPEPNYALDTIGEAKFEWFDEVGVCNEEQNAVCQHCIQQFQLGTKQLQCPEYRYLGGLSELDVSTTTRKYTVDVNRHLKVLVSAIGPNGKYRDGVARRLTKRSGARREEAFDNALSGIPEQSNIISSNACTSENLAERRQYRIEHLLPYMSKSLCVDPMRILSLFHAKSTITRDELLLYYRNETAAGWYTGKLGVHDDTKKSPSVDVHGRADYVRASHRLILKDVASRNVGPFHPETRFKLLKM